INRRHGDRAGAAKRICRDTPRSCIRRHLTPLFCHMQKSEAKAESTIVRPAGFTPSLSSMDVPRAGVAAKKRKRRIIMIAGGAVALIAATFAISRLKPAVPSVDRSTVWVDTVKRGDRKSTRL